MHQPDKSTRCFLIYGQDQGLVSERASCLAKAFATEGEGPFNLAEIPPASLKENPSRLLDEACSMTFFGGSKVIRIRGATDALAPNFRDYLSGNMTQALVIVEAGALKAKSPLRAVFEESKQAAAIPCYSDDKSSLTEIIREQFEDKGVSIAPEAFSCLLESLGSDRLVSRRELEKLSLYIGAAKIVTLNDVQACVGDNAAVSLDNIVYAAFGGERQALNKELQRTFFEETPPVSVLRAAARHLMRLHLAAALVAKGYSTSQAMKSLKPPVFYKQENSFSNQLRLWNEHKISQALELLTGAELECKTTGLPDQAICGRTLMRIAQAARA